MSVNNFNLGMNNYHGYNKYSENNMNSHIIQGSLFNQYTDKYNSVTKNKGSFLSQLTSGFGSVIEAMESFESVQKNNDDLQRTNIISEHENEMNKLSSEYSTMYNSFIENNSSLSDEERKDIEKELLRKQNRLKLLAENIKNEMAKLLKDNNLNNASANASANASDIVSANASANENASIIEGYRDFEDLNIDETTTHAKLETTNLSMTSNYYFYLVYFIVAITLLSFTFNIMVNPNADVMNALFVVGGIVVIFLISKMMS